MNRLKFQTSWNKVPVVPNINFPLGFANVNHERRWIGKLNVSHWYEDCM